MILTRDRVVLTLAMTLMLLPVGSAKAGITLNFQDSLQPTIPAAGWSYLYNRDGPIGDSAHPYVALSAVSQPNSFYYDIGGSSTLPVGNAYTFFGKDTAGQAIGHPGPSTHQGAGFEGFAIAAYRLTAATDDVAISNSILTNMDKSTEGLDVYVYKNSPGSTPTSVTSPGLGSTTPFNVDLGAANAGDLIYVAVGSRNDHSYDSFHLNYDITIATPEPSTFVLAAIAGVLTLGYRLRRRLAPGTAMSRTGMSNPASSGF